ncbi:SDR family oxidoreductase [Xanthomonas citri]|uniref:NAD(P)-dependent oxidoreductase n=2 Tax=Xanthomonas citri TaxID=346 RepID=A0AB33C5I8_XANCI|nr:SDR family oxidoreductase [Xanthomonas citri]MBV6782574.1 SDR family oxidoreductase [Xanthomonas campestris pv. trichodesmae]AMU96765.1 NAD-dependent dehydratase [Xanthomonas citri pv. aurantifolii]AMV01112.1 NAD-dependent dehydratase [Xanthomonas citri pv. aurantifolii]ASK90197.1 NAD(P)-dependent oxidoreductase [Xanthomonas citri pv. vignicola]ASL02765.1 NAD(P)-dependent oxidoreductase [Xanthomonas citri pv. vignicola]
MSRVLVIGGHGKVARLLTPLLVQGGHQVTALFRNPAHEDDVIADGATPVVFDIEHAQTDAIAAQLAGHDAVVWSAGAGGGDAARTYAVDRDAAIRSMHAAEQARLRRYVMVSYLGAGLEHGIGPDDAFFAYAQAKAAADAHLRSTTLDWTVLGPGRLTLDPPSGRITRDPGSDADGGVSRANVAQVIAAALATPGSIGKTMGFIDGQTPIAQALSQLE